MIKVPVWVSSGTATESLLDCCRCWVDLGLARATCVQVRGESDAASNEKKGFRSWVGVTSAFAAFSVLVLYLAG